jgi:type II secretory pathway predicted ATPase ExeA/LysM repeat protein
MNYNSFFGFSDSPFLDVPDQKFLFLSKKHEQALAELTEFVAARQGITLVSGDDGVGKTMLMQALIQRLPQSFQPLILTKPAAEPLAITLMIAQSLGLDLGERTPVNITPLADAIQAAAQQQQYFLLIMEDAHLLTDQNLEEIYMLSQLKQQGQQLMPIILVGRKGLVPKVSSKTNQRLHDLIRKNIFLSSLTFEETTLYIDHRLQQVGSSFKERFADGCLGQIFSRTSGVPRRINQVCDQALNRAWQENRSRVTRDLLGGEELQTTPYKPLGPPSKWRSLSTVASVITGVLLAGLAIFILYNNYVSVPSNPTLPPAPAPAAPAVPAVPEKAPVAPLQQETTPAPATVPQPQPSAPTAEQVTRKPEPPPAAPPAPPEPIETGPLPSASSPPATTPPVPQAGEPPAEPESAKTTTYQVAPEDRLLKIVSTYYPDDKDIGYDAVILANPRIINEDFIYPGQTLKLPKVDKGTNIITIGGHEYFKIYGQYYSSLEVTRATAKLKELQLHFVVRETEIPGEGKIYRIFLGSYDSTNELKKAMAMLGKN